MKFLLALAFTISSFAGMDSFAFTVNPIIRASGQVLSVTCDPKKDLNACMSLCNNASKCEIQEAYCRSCAGTQNLKLKRILDSVGTSTVASGLKTAKDLLTILKSGNFATLHSMTIYNYSGVYDGEQIRGQFRYLCPNLPWISDKMGTLLLGIDPKSNNVTGVLGAFCPDDKTGEAAFYGTNSRWQL